MPFNRRELYNLRQDPGENNLAQIIREIFDESSTTMQQHMQKAGLISWQKTIHIK
jgi:hypothetical protein